MDAPDDNSPDRIEQVLGPGGLLSRQLPSYEARPMQLSMAHAVQRALRDQTRLVVEAGTGTGKTLAYLVPAVLSGLKVVISTGTKTLQEQIYSRDLPMLLSLMQLELPVACMKGLSNYLCLRRLDEHRRSAGTLLPDPRLEPLLRWAGSTESGDRAELAELPDGGTLWSEVSPSSDTRIGPRCAFYEDCFVTRMRRQGAAARVVVVNHHLLFADLMLRAAHPEAAVLPAYEALVLDEAHQLEGIATSFFGHSVSSGMFLRVGRDARKVALLDGDRTAERLTERMEQGAAELFHQISLEMSLLQARRSRGPARMKLESPPLAGEAQQVYLRLDSLLEAMALHLQGAAEKGREDLANLARRVTRLRDGLALFDQRPGEGFILWAQQQQRGRGFSLHASPVEVGPLLRETLLAEQLPMVFTSATLAAGSSRGRSSLGYFRQRVGLAAPAPAEPPPEHQGEPEQDRDLELEQLEEVVQELVLPSPFDFARQALMYVPSDLPQPHSADFVPAVADRVTELLQITCGRALVLFTSHRNLALASELLSGRLPYTMLCQGDRPRSLLLEQFREETSSVLLATASFWEGVDVAGESLSLVVMDKLPFAVPDDPLTSARMDLLRRQGRDPFNQYQLPQAALSLKQGFGRLIRHRQDRGVVAVLDSRLVKRGYGRFLVESLPRCPRTRHLQRVREFFAPAAAPG